jgi:5-methylcytosine-specific restriction enzyme A
MTWSNESLSKRGLGAQWQRLRLAILERDNYLCQCPDCKGKRHTVATEVDHILPKAQVTLPRFNEHHFTQP